MERNQRNDERNLDRGSNSSEEILQKKLWKLAVIPKVRVFWWRVLRGILPDYGTLSRRHVKDDSTCGICRASEETLQHALTEYSHAKLFWSAAKELLQIKLPRLHPRTWAVDILCEQAILEKDRAMMITLMYSIWNSRNNVTHGEKVYDPWKSLEFVTETVLSMELPHDLRRPVQPRPRCLWQKPPIDVVKLNSDGAIQATLGVAGSGVVARDSVGFCGAMCKNYEGVDDPLTIEALALRDAVVFAKSRQYQQIVCEVDCSNLVRHWLGRKGNRSVISPILAKINSLSSFFNSFSVVFSRRETNQAAHNCARHACTQVVSNSWLDDPPEFLAYNIEADCNSDVI
jgi:hypothetical protein